MNELLYFSSVDLLIRVDYSPDTNALRYWTNRETDATERRLVEQYLLSEFAARVGFYERAPSLFICMGTDTRLNDELETKKAQEPTSENTSREQRVEAEVRAAIRESMKVYYFERLGDEILAFRHEVEQGASTERIRDAKVRMSQLLGAYNLYSGQRLSLSEVLPADLRDYL
ncbi:MAG: hypothetical protein ONB30_00985 [candidate division KSB1 bacterium]|nr:hypothetical protein [candidate division KSB1 bacterium]MDZ7337092.1 hypothetical protein [candidate division KSB1 bacterium]MDZ7386566.1 hypothetical protein [candidate division KSB1 bacterium]MDZ7392449.1 hypothetical protein [candidate division KSB1 bacterium]MDZ7413134.1 hypothetical protein [candidate division KSB1 bacterium]